MSTAVMKERITEASLLGGGAKVYAEQGGIPL